MPEDKVLAEDQIQCISFNQDATHIAVGWRRAWSVFTCQPFAPCASGDCGVGVIQMLFSSSLIAIVGCGERAGDSPRRLRLWNSSTAAPVFEIPFATDILNVLMNRSRLIVVIAQATHIFELATMRMLHTLETDANPHGLAALTHEGDTSVCALLPTASSGPGRVVLFDAAHGHAMSTIAAHHSPLAALALNARGDMVATASLKGTVIRVHGVATGQLLHTFRRGTARATIHSIAFSTEAPKAAEGDLQPATAADAEPAEGRASPGAAGRASPGAAGRASPGAAGRASPGNGCAGGSGSASASKQKKGAITGPLLCAASSTGTVHVWRLGEVRVATPRGGGSSGGATARRRGPLGGLREKLANTASAAQAGRDVAHVHVKIPPQKEGSWCRAALRDGGTEDGKTYLQVVTSSGSFLMYTLEGGACTLLDERRLVPAAQ